MDFRSFAIVATIVTVVFGCGCAANYLREYAASNAKLNNNVPSVSAEFFTGNSAIHTTNHGICDEFQSNTAKDFVKCLQN